MFDASYGDAVDGIHCLANSVGKDYAMNYRASVRYLVWRLAGAGTPIRRHPHRRQALRGLQHHTATPNPNPTPTPTACSPLGERLVRQLDTATKGSWRNSYGGDGYNTVNELRELPELRSSECSRLHIANLDGFNYRHASPPEGWGK